MNKDKITWALISITIVVLAIGAIADNPDWVTALVIVYSLWRVIVEGRRVWGNKEE